MSRLTRSVVGAVLLGQVVGLLGWLDPLFVPLVLIGPPITGAIAASRQVRYAWIALVWCSAGLNMVWTDWVVNHEDQVFHLALSVVMPLLTGIGWVAVRAAKARTRGPAPAAGVR